VNGSFHGRAEGNDNAATIGAYKDWTASLYTYTSIGTADRSTYLPRFRIDNDFNFKIGSQKNVVLTFGVTSIDYFTGYKDLIVSAGPTIYWHQFIGQYRFFYNQSDPDDIYSHSHLFRLGYGKEGRQWTFIGYSFGNQAYMASPMINRQEVNNDSWEAILQHRHWLNSNYGIFGSISFFKLDNGYEKTGVCFGVFYEF
jgi:YaiO family outer membrane protein